MLELVFVLTSYGDEVIGLAPDCLLQYNDDGLLNLLVRVVDMDEDLLHSVGVEARRPISRQVIKEDFEGSARLEADTILGIVQALEELRVDFNEAIAVQIGAHEGHKLTDKDYAGKAQVMEPIII